jgi:hypothetical protein
MSDSLVSHVIIYIILLSFHIVTATILINHIYDSQSRRLCYTEPQHLHAVAGRCLESTLLRLLARARLAYRREIT